MEVNKKNKDFIYFFILINLVLYYLNSVLNLKKKLTYSRKLNQSIISLSTSKFFLCIGEVFDIGFFYFPKNELMYRGYNLFKVIFYSTNNISLNVTIYIYINIVKHLKFINKKISTFYF